MATAADEYSANTNIGSGEINDEIRCHDTKSGIFDKAAELGSTKAFFFGHGHRNNAHIMCDGINLCYSMKTGINVYFEYGILGGVAVDLSRDGSFEISRIYI